MFHLDSVERACQSVCDIPEEHEEAGLVDSEMSIWKWNIQSLIRAPGLFERDWLEQVAPWRELVTMNAFRADYETSRPRQGRQAKENEIRMQ